MRDQPLSWEFPDLIVSTFKQLVVCNLYALFCALLRSFADLYLLICMFLHPTAFRTTAFGNFRLSLVVKLGLPSQKQSPPSVPQVRAPVPPPPFPQTPLQIAPPVPLSAFIESKLRGPPPPPVRLRLLLSFLTEEKLKYPKRPSKSLGLQIRQTFRRFSSRELMNSARHWQL